MASFRASSLREAPQFRAVLLALVMPVLACATTSAPAGAPGGSSGSGASGGGLGSSGAPFGGNQTLGGDGGTVASGGDGGHMQRCNAAGQCSCIAIASIGHEGAWGPCSSDTTTAFQDWLNSESTAKVDNYDTVKPTLTPAFLAQYDVIVLQWMVANGQKDNDGAPWVFASDEISALEDWVKGGGGIIALNGYQCNGSGCTIYDTTATNQLLSFTDIQFNSDDNLDPDVAPGYPGNAGTYDYCWGGSIPLGGPFPAGDGGIGAIGTWDPTTPIGAHVTSVGGLVARSIHSTSAVVDSTDGTHAFAVHEQVGQGHIFAYGDEWITYSGEWLGTGACLGDGGVYANTYDPCYQKSPTEVFQIPQLWYNSISYAASSVQCFMISDPNIIPR